MGIRANALTDHRVPDYRDQAAVVLLLAQTLPAAVAVRDYWRGADPDDKDTIDTWTAYFAHNPPEDDYLRYDGPGGISITFGQRVAIIHATARWSGFVTIEPLHHVHAVAFRSVAHSLGGTRVVLIPDYDPVEEIALYDGSSLDECVALLQQRWGAPYPTTKIVTDDLEVYHRRKFPTWYFERL